MPQFLSRPLQRAAGGMRLSLVVFGVIALDHAYLQHSDKETQQRALSEQLDIPVGMQLQLPFLQLQDACSCIYSLRRKRDTAACGDEFGISVGGVLFRTESSWIW